MERQVFWGGIRGTIGMTSHYLMVIRCQYRVHRKTYIRGLACRGECRRGWLSAILTRSLRCSTMMPYRLPILTTPISYLTSDFHHAFLIGQNIWGPKWKACAQILCRASMTTSWHSTRTTQRSLKNTRHMPSGFPMRPIRNVSLLNK